MKIVVRVTNWIGDVIMNIPALEGLRAAYPTAEIVAVAVHHGGVKHVKKDIHNHMGFNRASLLTKVKERVNSKKGGVEWAMIQ